MRISDWSSDVCSSDLKCGDDLGPAWSHRHGFHRLELLAHHLVHPHAVAQYLQQLLDGGGQFAQFACNLVTTERGQPVEAQPQDGTDLRFRQALAVDRKRVVKGKSV